MPDTSGIRIGVSACLLGHRTRYDGEHARDVVVADILAERYELVPVCPEDELGMGTPRETVDLWGGTTAPRMLGTHTRTDWTDRMNTWAAGCCDELEAAGLSGYVFKSRSPSCGVVDVKLHQEDGTVRREGRGLFAMEIARRFPDLPVAEETDLQDPESREAFLARVETYHRTRA
ncbi:MAG: DUF523 domain-containing protein [bacterium]|nr:DUF523 domain-containing protein [bacterium]